MKKSHFIIFLILLSIFVSCSGLGIIWPGMNNQENESIACPAGLSVEAVSQSTIKLKWTDSSDNETGFEIVISTDNATFTSDSTVTKDVTTCTITGLAPSTLYYIKIRAFNNEIISDFTQAITASTNEIITPLPIIADHSYGNLASLKNIPVTAINTAKSNLLIAYGHTSHGGQITTGMTGLNNFANTGILGSDYTENLFSWSHDGSGSSLHLFEGDYYGDGPLDHDAGYYPGWYDETVEFLNDPANSEYNVIMWSWCGQVSYTSEAAMITNYLEPMTALEAAYPGVTFIYMTGHLDGTGLTGTLHLRNEQIREYCLDNNKILYDFADIESYDPDGTYYGDKFVTDGCNYDSNNSGGTTQSTDDPPLPINGDNNWALDWQSSHTENTDWFDCISAHSQPLNANMKAYAAWWLWARIAGWDGY